MIFAPDDDDFEDENLVKDASDQTSSGDIVTLSSSSRAEPGGHRKSGTTITTAKKTHHPRADFELEARIEQIRRRYRQQERILEEEIAKLEQTYIFELAELENAAEDCESQADLDGYHGSTDENWEWETRSEYPPTEPRGMSRSPSPVFTY